MAKQAFANHKNIYVKPYHGLTVEFARRVDAQAIVRGLRVISDFELEYQMSHTNRQLAPEIEFICLMTHQEYAFVSSSIVKEVFRLAGDISKMAPAYVTQALQAKIDTEKEGPKSAPLVSLRD